MHKINPIKYIDQNPHHIICRKNLLTSEVDYLDGITYWGIDDEEICKVTNTIWNEEFKYRQCLTFEYAKNLLDGIKKYANDGNYHYYISALSISVTPIAEQIKDGDK